MAQKLQGAWAGTRSALCALLAVSLSLTMAPSAAWANSTEAPPREAADSPDPQSESAASESAADNPSDSYDSPSLGGNTSSSNQSTAATTVEGSSETNEQECASSPEDPAFAQSPSRETSGNAPPSSESSGIATASPLRAGIANTAKSGIALLSSIEPGPWTPGVQFSEEPALVYTTASAPSEVTATYLLGTYYQGYGYQRYVEGMQAQVEVIEGADLVEATCSSPVAQDGITTIQLKALGSAGSAKIKVSFHHPSYSYIAGDVSAELEVNVLDSPNYVSNATFTRDGEQLDDELSLYAFPSPDPNDRGALFQQSANVDVSFVGEDPGQTTPGGVLSATVEDESVASVSTSGSQFTIQAKQEGETNITLTVTPKVPNPETPDQTFTKAVTLKVAGLEAPKLAAGTAQLTFGAAEAGSKSWSANPLITYNTPENAENESFNAWLASKGSTLDSFSLYWHFVTDATAEDPDVFSINPIAANWWSAYSFRTIEPGLTYLTVTDTWGQSVSIPVVVTATSDYPTPAFLRDEYTIEAGTSIENVAASWMTATAYHYDPNIRTNSAPVYFTTEDLGTDEETGETNNVVSLSVPSASFSVNTDPYVAPDRSTELDGLVTYPQHSGITANHAGYVLLYAYYLQPNAPYGSYPVVLDTCWVNVVDQIDPIESIEILSLETDEEGTETLGAVPASLNISETQTLRATPTPYDATQMIGWESSDTSVLTVDQTGVVCAVGEGSATVTAFAADSTGTRIEGGAQTSVEITVVNGIRKLSVTSVTQPDDVLSPLKIDYNSGAYRLAAQVLPSTAVKNPAYRWSVEDVEGENVCLIRQDGTLIPWSYGTARVTCSLDDTTVATSFEVVVMDIMPATSVSISEDAPDTLVAGATDTATFTATVEPANSTDAVVWSSSNENVLAIDPETGIATLAGDGTATVKASLVDEDGVTRTDVVAQKQVQCQVPLTGIDMPDEVSLNKVRMTVSKYVWPAGMVDVETDVVNSVAVEVKLAPEKAGGVSYTWEAADDVDPTAISGWSASGSKLTVTSDTDKGATEKGSCRFKVTATDRYGNSFEKTVIVNVVPNAVPRLYVNGVEISEDAPLEMIEGDVVQVECYLDNTRIEDGRMLIGVSTGGGASPRDYGGWGGWLKATEANEDSPYECIVQATICNENGQQNQYIKPKARVIVHPRPYDQPPTTISVSPSKVTLNLNEDEYDMTYSLRWPTVSKGGTLICPEGSGYGYEQSSRVRVAWSSSNPAIAEVDGQTGHVTPLSTGTVYVYGTVMFQSDTGAWEQIAQGRGRVDVLEPAGETPARRVTVSSIPQMKVGESVRATAQVLPYPYAPQTVTWSSSNPQVATVDAETGVVVATGEGACTITATTPSGIAGTTLLSVNGFEPAAPGENAGGNPAGGSNGTASDTTRTASNRVESASDPEQPQQNVGLADANAPTQAQSTGKTYRNVEEADHETTDVAAVQLRVALVVFILALIMLALVAGGIYRYQSSSRRQR